MDHVAIMRKSWGLTQKILTGEKKIESRWYKAKHTPWGKIKSGDTIYFKDSGEPIRIRAKVSRVLQFSNLNPEKVKDLLNKFGKDDGLTKREIPKYHEMFKDKKYCLLIFLEDPTRVKPFSIHKQGFGAMSAWVAIKNIRKIILT